MGLSRDTIQANLTERSFAKAVPDELKQSLMQLKEQEMFVETTEDKGVQLRYFYGDFVLRNFTCNGKRFLEYFSPEKKPEDITDDDIRNKLEIIFGDAESARAILEAHSQFVAFVIYNLFIARIECDIPQADIMGVQRYVLMPNKSYSLDLFKDEKDKQIKVKCTIHSIPIVGHDERAGSMPGPITTFFVLGRKASKDDSPGRYGFQLDTVCEPLPKYIGDALRGKKLSLKRDIFQQFLLSTSPRLSLWQQVSSVVRWQQVSNVVNDVKKSIQDKREQWRKPTFDEQKKLEQAYYFDSIGDPVNAWLLFQRSAHFTRIFKSSATDTRKIYS